MSGFRLAASKRIHEVCVPSMELVSPPELQEFTVRFRALSFYKYWGFGFGV